jgi:hypothetical protein
MHPLRGCFVVREPRRGNKFASMETLKAIYARIKAIGRRVQARAVIVGLWSLYWLGFGPVKLLMTLFRRDLLDEGDPQAPSFWLEASPADYDPAQLEHQS